VTPLGDRRRIEPEQLRDVSVAAPAELDGLEPGKEAPLLFVEQPEEQDDRRLQLFGDRAPRPGLRLAAKRLASRQLGASLGGVRRAREVPPPDLFARHEALLGEVSHAVLRAHVKHVIELIDEISGAAGVDQRRRSLHQAPMSGEPNRLERPQTERVESGELVECVVAAAMRVARSIAQLRELAEHRAIRGCTERRPELGHRRDHLPSQESGDGIRRELFGSHDVRLAPPWRKSDITIERTQLPGRMPEPAETWPKQRLEPACRRQQ
jgi:hypothetical protein